MINSLALSVYILRVCSMNERVIIIYMSSVWKEEDSNNEDWEPYILFSSYPGCIWQLYIYETAVYTYIYTLTVASMRA